MAAVIVDGVLRIEPELRQSRQQLLVQHLQLDPRQVGAQAAVRAGAEGDVGAVLPLHVEGGGVCELARVQVGGGQVKGFCARWRTPWPMPFITVSSPAMNSTTQ